MSGDAPDPVVPPPGDTGDTGEAGVEPAGVEHGARGGTA